MATPLHVRSESVVAEPVDPAERFSALQAVVHAAIAAVGLVFLAPLFVVLGAAIKLSSPGPVFYRGARVGRDRRPFTIYKFRTLAVGAEQKIGARLLTPEERALYGGRFGAWLKRTKLDELPQLINVVRGEMRLVGPRPIRPILLEAYEREIPGYGLRFSVAPGMTGVAQLRGGYYTHERQKLRFDLAYMRRRSIAFDLLLVLLTFVKIADRILQAGLVAIFLLLFVSFVPSETRRWLSLELFGFEIDAILLVILGGVAMVATRLGWSRFSIRRGPLNVGLLAFLCVGFVSAAFSSDRAATLRLLGYYTVSGFFVSFLLVNSFQSRQFAGAITRTIAITSVVMSALGLVEIWLGNVGVPSAFAAYGAGGTSAMPRMEALIGNPASLSVYLLLGIPLLFAEVSRAREQHERELWIVFATISMIGIVFTQTRTGLAALLVTGAFFLSRRRPQALLYVALFLVGIAIIAALGAPRFAPAAIAVELERWLGEARSILGAISASEWIFGNAASVGWLDGTRPVSGPTDDAIANMHVTLARELGVGAWLVWLAVVAAVAWRMLDAYRHAKNDAQRTQLWAILSCIVGFVVAMNGMNAFHQLPLQIYFWSLVGIGLGIANQIEPSRSKNLIWRFGDAGD